MKLPYNVESGLHIKLSHPVLADLFGDSGQLLITAWVQICWLQPQKDFSVYWNKLFLLLSHSMLQFNSVSFLFVYILLVCVVKVCCVCFPPLQFQLQIFDIVCSTSWANRDKCCELPGLVRSSSYFSKPLFTPVNSSVCAPNNNLAVE